MNAGQKRFLYEQTGVSVCRCYAESVSKAFVFPRLFLLKGIPKLNSLCAHSNAVRVCVCVSLGTDTVRRSNLLSHIRLYATLATNDFPLRCVCVCVLSVCDLGNCALNQVSTLVIVYKASS